MLRLNKEAPEESEDVSLEGVVFRDGRWTLVKGDEVGGGTKQENVFSDKRFVNGIAAAGSKMPMSGFLTDSDHDGT